MNANNSYFKYFDKSSLYRLVLRNCGSGSRFIPRYICMLRTPPQVHYVCIKTMKSNLLEQCSKLCSTVTVNNHVHSGGKNIFISGKLKIWGKKYN